MEFLSREGTGIENHSKDGFVDHATCDMMNVFGFWKVSFCLGTQENISWILDHQITVSSSQRG